MDTKTVWKHLAELAAISAPDYAGATLTMSDHAGVRGLNLYVEMKSGPGITIERNGDDVAALFEEAGRQARDDGNAAQPAKMAGLHFPHQPDDPYSPGPGHLGPSPDDSGDASAERPRLFSEWVTKIP